MTSNILLVAVREFRQIAAMRSFWLTLLLIPVALGVGPLLTGALDDDEPTRVLVIDRAGGSAKAAIEQRFAAEQDRSDLAELSRYVRRHGLEDAAPQAPWAQHDRWYTDADIAAFRAGGGTAGAIAAIGKVKAEETPAFDAPPADFAFLPEPAAMGGLSGPALTRAIDATIADENEETADTRPELVVLVGSGYPADPTVRVWSNEQPSSRFVTIVQDVLTGDLRQRLLTVQGVAPETARAVQGAAPAIAISTPPPGSGAREALLVRSIVPLALAYILMMSLMLSGSWMLQGSVEERANKLLESLLACISPNELMYGKLVGTLAIGLSMILTWVGFAAIATFWMHGAIADLIRPALAPLTSPGVVLAMIYFFVAGYVAISVIFIAIGSLADSMSEAQGYLMPVLLAILLPITILIQAILLGNSGAMVQALTWIPIWTPFTVLARLGAGIETWELIGAGLVLAAFVALEIVFLGRLFRASLLATGQKPGLKLLMERFRASPA